MNCKKTQSLMLDSLYRELSPRKKKALEKHLHRCPSCAEEFANQKATVSAFQSLDLENPSSELSEIVREMAVKELEKEALLSRGKSTAIWKPALASIAAAVLVTVGVIYYLPKAKMEKQIQEVSPQADRVLSSEPAAANAMRQDVAPPIQGNESQESTFPAGFVSGEKATASYRKSQEEQEASPASVLNDKIGGVSQPPAAAETPLSLKKEIYITDSLEEDRRVLPENKEKSIPEKDALGSLRFKSHPADIEMETPRESSSSTVPILEQKAGEITAGIAAEKQDAGLTEGHAVIDARFRLGQAYQEANEFERAITVYLYIEEHYPDYPSLGRVYLAAADCYLALGKSAEALKSYEIVRDRYPELREEAKEKIFSVLSQEPEDTAVSQEDK
jgi:hypothetical protein